MVLVALGEPHTEKERTDRGMVQPAGEEHMDLVVVLGLHLEEAPCQPAGEDY